MDTKIAKGRFCVDTETKMITLGQFLLRPNRVITGKAPGRDMGEFARTSQAAGVPRGWKEG